MKNIKLIEARKKAHLTQVEAAKKVKITEVCYQRYEAGTRLPKVDVAIRIAKALNSSVEILFGTAIPIIEEKPRGNGANQK